MRDAHTASGLRQCPPSASTQGQSSVPGCCPPKGQGVSSSCPSRAHPPASIAGGTGYNTGPCFSEASAATASPAAFSSAGWRLPPAPLSARTLPPASWTPGPPFPSCTLTRFVPPPRETCAEPFQPSAPTMGCWRCAQRGFLPSVLLLPRGGVEGRGCIRGNCLQETGGGPSCRLCGTHLCWPFDAEASEPRSISALTLVSADRKRKTVL